MLSGLLIGTVEAVVTPGLTARLVPVVRSRKGHRRYDPVMLPAYSYLRECCRRGRSRTGADFPGSHEPEQPRVRKFMRVALFNADGMMSSLAGWGVVVDEGETS